MVQASGAGTRRTHNRRDSCHSAYPRTQPACHRAEALAHPGKPALETPVPQSLTRPLTAAEDYQNNAAGGAAQICSDAHGRRLAPVLSMPAWLVAGFCAATKYPLTQDRSRCTLLMTMPAAPASKMEDKGRLNASWSDSTCIRFHEFVLSRACTNIS